jgi:hypothetical protein
MTDEVAAGEIGADEDQPNSGRGQQPQGDNT